MNSREDISSAIQGLHNRLDMLKSINEATVLVPGGPQERSHQIIEEAYVILGHIEIEVDALREELDYHHKRLENARDTVVAEATQERPSAFVSAEPKEILEDEV